MSKTISRKRLVGVLERARLEMRTMQSRVDAILAVDEIVETLNSENFFGEQYQSLLEEDSKDLGEAIELVASLIGDLTA